MDLRKYYEEKTGRGVLATADLEGRVNAAVYARPHMMDDGTAAFVMAEKLTLANLKSNPHAAYLFFEAGEGYRGVRLYLRKIKDEINEKAIAEICRRCGYSYQDAGSRHLVYFQIEKILPLIGA